VNRAANSYNKMKRGDFLKSGGMLIACTCGASLSNGCKVIAGNSDAPLLSENELQVIVG
jgi:hypothetical protein